MFSYTKRPQQAQSDTATKTKMPGPSRWTPAADFQSRESALRPSLRTAMIHSIRTRLQVSDPGDELEQEADRVADRVMRIRGVAMSNGGPPPMHSENSTQETQCEEGLLQRREDTMEEGNEETIQRTCTSCPLSIADDESRTIQRQFDGAAGPERLAFDRTKASEMPKVATVLRSPGSPLEPAVRTFMEARLGYGLHNVRVHTDAVAADSARSLSATAYTIGSHVIFAARRYAPATRSGAWLLAHELAHVVQQSAASASAVPRPGSLRSVSRLDTSFTYVQRHKDDFVAYSGGQSGTLSVFAAGTPTYQAPAVSGNPGRGEWELSAGPIPTGKYTIHPRVTRSPISTLQKNGVCGADAIRSGYQEVTCDVPSPCSGRPAHYCNRPCPTAADPARMCFTPLDCWGPIRIKIEGGAQATAPGGKKVHRHGFFIHGGNPSDAVSAGCIKSLDNQVFSAIRSLSGVGGAVPLCVGSVCPSGVQQLLQLRAKVLSLGKQELIDLSSPELSEADVSLRFDETVQGVIARIESAEHVSLTSEVQGRIESILYAELQHRRSAARE
jgi:hypothetical protein